MTDWVKIQTFERVHQAELRKDILEQNNIHAVIVNEKDSLFLLGEIELYVRKSDEKKARAYIDDFKGLTKINSFVELKPVLLFQDILKEEGIQTELKRKEHNKFILDNFELYVKNIDLENVIPFLTGEKLSGWQKIITCRKVRQTQFYVNLLAENNIDTLVIKKKDSEFHLEEVYIYVKSENTEKTNSIISKLYGYTKIREAEEYNIIETYEETLAYENIEALISKNQNDMFELYVKIEDTDNANEILNLRTEWVELETFENIANVTFFKNILETENIPTVIINEKDSSFLFGEIELHIRKSDYNKGKEIIDSYKN